MSLYAQQRRARRAPPRKEPHARDGLRYCGFVASISRTLLAGSLTLVLAAGGSARLRAQREPSETKLKAGSVATLVQFVEWPPAALEGRTTVNLCVTGAGRFAPDLQRLEVGETLKGLPIAVRRVQRTREIAGCQALILPTSETSRASRQLWLQQAATWPTLTVSDDTRFLDDGGIVRIRIVDGRPQFDVNDAAAQRVGLRISSRLLGLAGTVRRGPS